MAGRRRALIVANGEYDNAGLQRLGSPAADADALAGVLADRAISDFDVRVVRNETAYTVQAEIEDLCVEGRPDDVLLLHFSCHGLKDDTGAVYFAARNTRPDRLRSTAVPAQFVQQCIRQSRSRSIVLLLDCCYGGAFGQGVAVRASGDANVLDSFRGGHGRAVITASNSIEYAFEGARLASDEPAQPSVFTSALVEGLRTGEADRDEDGWIALGELYEYLFDRVRERNPKQTPSRDIEMQGELYLAKSRRRRIKPSPVPADLAAATAAENPFTRLGAVAELRRRLSSDNLPVAMGAFEALRAMASTDIEHVSAAASDAMAFAVVRVDADVLSFAGDVVRRRIRLLGPPVARACRFEASHGWIEVHETTGGAEVTVTPGAEARQGKVVVTGPTGETVVEIKAAAVVAGPGVPSGEEPEQAAGGAADAAVGTEVASAGSAESDQGAVAEPAAAAEAGVGSAEAAESEPAAVAEPGAATTESAGPEPAAPAEAPDPLATQPGAASLPSASRPSTSREPVAVFLGLLAVGGGVLMAVSLAFEYQYNLSDYSHTLAGALPGLEWYVWLAALAAIVAGIAATATAYTAGVAVAALWGLVTTFTTGRALTVEDGYHLGAAFGFLFAGLLAVFAAGAGAVWLARRQLGFRRPGRYEWAAMALGLIGAAGLFLQFSADSSSVGAVGAVALTAVLTVAVPVLAGVTGAGRFAAGWSAAALGIAVAIGKSEPEGANLAGLIVFTASLVLGVVAGVLITRNQPNGRQL
ncbi:caspase family protein [Amycolatopsis sp. NPDC049688]|uniref:caspase family protein n=1 Tax=Amycolatopsis sp. NPDC049688 TaxID=3154733 RepID=UPI00342F6108